MFGSLVIDHFCMKKIFAKFFNFHEHKEQKERKAKKIEI